MDAFEGYLGKDCAMVLLVSVFVDTEMFRVSRLTL